MGNENPLILSLDRLFGLRLRREQQGFLSKARREAPCDFGTPRSSQSLLDAPCYSESNTSDLGPRLMKRSSLRQAESEMLQELVAGDNRPLYHDEGLHAPELVG